MSRMTSFADLTTIGVGGPVSSLVEPTEESQIVDTVRRADDAGIPVFVIGGGSNILVSDDPFEGVVVRDARRGMSLCRGRRDSDGVCGRNRVHVEVEAGCVWDDFVADAVERGWQGVEGLSGIPGTVGASVVQNIGAYGQEVASTVESVRVWDRLDGMIRELPAERMRFGYRTSMLKASMYASGTVPVRAYFPTPRFVVLSVTFDLAVGRKSIVGYGQLVKALDVVVGDSMDVAAVRHAVLAIRGAKGMVEDANRYATDAMVSMRSPESVSDALSRQKGLDGGDLADRHSCGSFFVNPVLTTAQANRLPSDAPRFDAVLPDGSRGVKTSAAWLIEHAGFPKGFRLSPDSRASLSTRHTLALTNRGGATAAEIADLARTVAAGVDRAFAVALVPEPVAVGLTVLAHA